MSCTDLVCGTGGWTGPKPGDPDNNSLLSATPAYGGIDVSWTYPSTNPYAVAHTLLFRSHINNLDTAVQIAVVSGNFFYDKSTVNASLTYYYWIQLVSVNGTYGLMIGPASAMAKPTIEDMIELLTGRIDSGVLATSLKTEIANINLVGDNLLSEIQNRISANAALAEAIADVQSGAEQAMAFVQQEIIQRTEGDSALVSQLNTMASAVQNNLAVILEEKTTRANADSALSNQLAILSASTGANASAISQEQTARTTKDTALASDITTLYVKAGENAAAIVNESTIRTSIAESFANQMNTVSSTLYGNTALGEVGLTTKVTSVAGKVTEIGALYTAKVSVNGLIGGFGVYNNGVEVEAGFDVDRFWIGRTNANKRKPFIIENGVVYIDDAAINKLTFNKLRSEDGSFVFENGKLKANYLQVTELMGGAFTGFAWPAGGGTGFYLGPGGFGMGNYNTGKYVYMTSTGDFYIPGLSVVNGEMTISKANVINTLNIAGNAVSMHESRGIAAVGYLTGSTSFSIVMENPGTITIIDMAEIQGGSVNSSFGCDYFLNCNGSIDSAVGAGSQIATRAFLRVVVNVPSAGVYTGIVSHAVTGAAVVPTVQSFHRLLILKAFK